MSNKKTPSLYRNSTSSNSGIPQLYQTQKSRQSFSIGIRSYNKTSFQQSSTKKLLLLIILVIAVISIVSILNSNFGVVDEETNSTITIENPTTTLIGNDSVGSVSKSGPYGNSNSSVKIAYIFGVHPRENDSHRLMKQALDEKENLSYSYYIYQINVTENSDDFSQSRENGQYLAKNYVVPDILNDSFDAAIDCHYSDGSWGVERFVFTSVENNTISYKLSQNLAEHFEWLEYYNPQGVASSPNYLISPLNEGGVPSIIYESYSYDNDTTTLEHDKEFISFVDQWKF